MPPSSDQRRWRLPRRRYLAAGFSVIPGRLVWWRAPAQWGWTTDAHGPVLDLGRLRYYPRANRHGSVHV